MAEDNGNNVVDVRFMFVLTAVIFLIIQVFKIFFDPRSKKHSYTGQRDNKGRFHGKGTLLAANGDKYEGRFEKGRFSGQGKYFFSKGGRYEGQFKDGNFCGKGREVYVNGAEYEGQFLKGKRHNTGTMRYPNGSIFSGQWKDGKKHGKGTLKLQDGSMFKGKFLEGKKHGIGVFTTPDGKTTSGNYMHGRLVEDEMGDMEKENNTAGTSEAQKYDQEGLRERSVITSQSQDAGSGGLAGSSAVGGVKGTS